MTRAILFLFLFFPTLGHAAIREHVLPSGGYLNRLAVAADGTVWYTLRDSATVGRFSPNSEFVELKLPPPFAGLSDIVIGPDGNAWVTSGYGRLARIQSNFSFTEYLLSEQAYPRDLIIGPDSRLWFADPHLGSVGRVDPSTGVIDGLEIPSGLHEIALGPDGNVWYLGQESFGYVTPEGSVHAIPGPSLFPTWFELGPDNRLWFDRGKISLTGDIEWELMGGYDAARDVSGRLSIVSFENAVRTVDTLGRIRIDPAPRPIHYGRGIAVGPDGRIWFGEDGRLAVIDPSEPPPSVELQRGDLISNDGVANCCFEGVHHESAHYRTRGNFFAKRIDSGPGALALSPDGELYSFANSAIPDLPRFLRIQPPSLNPVEIGRIGARPDGVFFNRLAEMYFAFVLGQTLEVVRIDRSTGNRLGATTYPLAREEERYPGFFRGDLAQDQCTLFFTTLEKSIHRVNICEGSTLPDFARDLPDYVWDLRLLPDDSVLLATEERIYRLSPQGVIQREYPVPDPVGMQAIALDIDGRSFWTGSGRSYSGSHSTNLHRIDLSTGAVLESVPSFGVPFQLMVVGEPRAAYRIPRTRGVRR